MAQYNEGNQAQTPGSQEPSPPPITGVEDSFYKYVQDKFQSAQSDRTTWVSRQVKFNKLRMRIKKSKTFPFIGCSNLRMPTAEIKIRKIKAALFNVLFGIRPIVQVVPPPGGNLELALKIEKFLDHLLTEVMHIQNKCIIALDQMLEQGFYTIKTYWKLEINERTENYDLKDFNMKEVFMIHDGSTSPEDLKKFFIEHFSIDMDDKVSDENEKAVENLVAQIHQGKDTVSFQVQDILYDAPDIALVAPEKCYVPADSGYDPQKCQCIIHEFFLPLQQLKTNAKYYGWDTDGVTAIEGYKTATYTGIDTQKQENKDLLEGITRLLNPSQLVKIREYNGWYDGVKTTGYVAPDFQKTLKKMGLPFDNGKWPFVKIFYELTDDRWFSHRGVPELAEDVIKEIDVQHNMKIDQQTVRNAPMWMYRAGMVNPNLIQLIPNQAIPVNGLQPLNDTLAMVNNSNTNVEYSYEKEEQILKGQLEEMFGQPDFNLQSMINKRQPRTLGEVNSQQQNMQQAFAIDAGMLTEQFSELVNMVWDLWCQYGSDDYEFNYFGQNGWEKIKLTKEEIQGQYTMTIRGNDRNTNPTVRIQKAQQILTAMENPVLLQSGVIGNPQLGAMLKRIYQYLEMDNWEELVNLNPPPTPEPPPPKVQELLKVDWKDLTPAVQAQILTKMGIQPDIQGMQLKSHEDLLAKADPHLNRLHQQEQGNMDRQHAIQLARTQAEAQAAQAKAGGNGVAR